MAPKPLSSSWDETPSCSDATKKPQRTSEAAEHAPEPLGVAQDSNTDQAEAAIDAESIAVHSDYADYATLLEEAELANLEPEEEQPLEAGAATHGAAMREQEQTVQADPKKLAADGYPEDLAQLRYLLLSKELVLLKQLQDKTIQPEDVSKVLAEALFLRSAQKDPRLSTALQPTVEDIFRNSIRRNPRELADTLFPIMGPAIRRSIAQTLSSMLQNLNKMLENSLSWKGLSWRLEAWRTGLPFSEVVLLHTLAYRVEQVFLIHSKTGIVLSHASNAGVQLQDADMISAMLTAIQDFARDCFTADQSDTLETMSIGELNVMLEPGPNAYLACVVRGSPPASLRLKLQEALELIQLENATILNTFTGNTEVFSTSRRHLEDCLETHYRNENKSIPFYVKLIPVLFVALLCSGIFFLWQQNNVFDNFVNQLQDSTGIVVTGSKGSYLRGWSILGMQDPLSPKSVATLLEEAPASIRKKTTLRFTDYSSSEPELVLKRVIKLLHPPEEVQITLVGTALTISGTAPMPWIMQTLEKAPLIMGVETVNTETLTDPYSKTCIALVKKIQAVSIYFPIGKDSPLPEEQEKVQTLIRDLVELDALSKRMGLLGELTILGFSDRSGDPQKNYDLSQARGQRLAALLQAHDVSMPISIRGLGADLDDRPEASTPEERNAFNPSRRIDVRVILQMPSINIPGFALSQ